MVPFLITNSLSMIKYNPKIQDSNVNKKLRYIWAYLKRENSMVNHNNDPFIYFVLKNGFNFPHSLIVSNDKFVMRKMQKYAPKLIFTVFFMFFGLSTKSLET